jgi:hypothetical protein
MADSIAMNLDELGFGKLAGFGQTIHNGYVDNAADYSSPLPTMPTFQGHINDLNKAITLWGSKGNRGGTKEYSNLLKRANIVKKDLTRLEKYAMTTQPDNGVSWRKLGFPLRKERALAGVLQAVQDFRRFIARNIPGGHIKLKWKKPLDTKRSMIKGYIVQTNDKSVYPEDPRRRILMNVIGIVTETTFMDTKPLPGPNYYWVTPFNSAGLGVRSGMVKVVMPMEEEEEGEE